MNDVGSPPGSLCLTVFISPPVSSSFTISVYFFHRSLFAWSIYASLYILSLQPVYFSVVSVFLFTIQLCRHIQFYSLMINRNEPISPEFMLAQPTSWWSFHKNLTKYKDHHNTTIAVWLCFWQSSYHVVLRTTDFWHNLLILAFLAAFTADMYARGEARQPTSICNVFKETQYDGQKQRETLSHKEIKLIKTCASGICCLISQKVTSLSHTYL